MEPLSPAPPPARPRRAPVRPGSILAVAALTVAVLLTGVAIAVTDNQTVDVSGGAAAKYVPADGHVEWTRDSLDAVRMTESARSIGYEDLLQLPTQASTATISLLDAGVRTAQLWRESTATIRDDSSGVQNGNVIDLHQLSADGLVLLASYGGTLGFTYSPPLVELSARVSPGATWSSAGDALPHGLLTYTAHFEASEPSTKELLVAAGLPQPDLAECVEVRGGSVYRDETGNRVLESDETNLWCEGRGRIASVATVNGDRVLVGLMAEPPNAAVDAALAAPRSWDVEGGWRTAEVPPVVSDPSFGEQPLGLSLANPPRRTQSGLLVAVNQVGDDVVALKHSSGTLVRQWLAHPGGDIVTLETVGDVTVVTTSQRKVLAYSEHGHRLWERDSPELILAPPTGAAGAVILVGLDGTVASVNSLTGKPNWERKLSADVILPAAVDRSSVLVADRAGVLTAFDRTSGETLWTVDSEQPPVGLFAASGVATLTGSDGFLRAYDAESGERLWTQRYRGFLRATAWLGRCALFVTNEVSACVDVHTGAVQWIRAGAQDAVTDGRHAVLFDEADARLLDAEGTTVSVWEIPSLALAINRYAVAGDDGFWVFRSYQPVLAVGQP